ncbi:uncharacterized protein [Euwallacea fornicatus]|uniref:uncharacterized protein n=1 Tax=Euwallacea fornicatus TaxID=995702 RepID=UPI00338DB93F
MKVLILILLAVVTTQLACGFIIQIDREKPSCVWYWYPRHPKNTPVKGPTTGTAVTQAITPIDAAASVAVSVAASVTDSATASGVIETTTVAVNEEVEDLGT